MSTPITEAVENQARYIEALDDEHFDLVERNARTRALAILNGLVAVGLASILSIINAISLTDPTNRALAIYTLCFFAIMWLFGVAMLVGVAINSKHRKRLRKIEALQAASKETEEVVILAILPR